MLRIEDLHKRYVPGRVDTPDHARCEYSQNFSPKRQCFSALY